MHLSAMYLIMCEFYPNGYIAGRYWTGYISIGLHKGAVQQDRATADLRAGVAAVSWLEKGVQTGPSFAPDNQSIDSNISEEASPSTYDREAGSALLVLYFNDSSFLESSGD